MVEGGGGKGALEIAMNLFMCDEEGAPHRVLYTTQSNNVSTYINLPNPKIEKYKYKCTCLL
jgi:hypothetical protein